MHLSPLRGHLDPAQTEPDTVPAVQAGGLERKEGGEMRPLAITLTPDLFAAVLSGDKRIISTKRNARKDRYFSAKTPDTAKINGVLYQITRIEGTATDWIISMKGDRP